MENNKCQIRNMEDKKGDVKKIEKEKKLSWVELSEEEVLKATDVSVCMYGKQNSSVSY